MAVEAQKRKRSVPPQKPAKSRKRIKVQDAETIPRKKEQNPLRTSRVGRIVRIDDLKWKDVAMPETMDDYEGFYGLEEIDDVEVVRDGNVVSYKALDDDVVKNDKGSGDGEAEADEEEEAESWDGFDENEEEILDQEPTSETTLERPKTKSESRVTPSDPGKITKSKTGDSTYEHDGPRTTRENLDEGLDDIGFAHLAEEELDAVGSGKNWADVPLQPAIRHAVGKLGFTSPTPIQKAVIPEIIDGLDVVGKASTGSGKTLAYGLPLLESFLTMERTEGSTDHIPLALILAPTRELAHQIDKHLTALCSNLETDRPRIATVIGGLSVQKQQRQLLKADLIIGTPGRLWDVVSSSPGFMTRLRQIRFIVIDEADRLLSHGNFKELDELLTALNREQVDEASESSESGSEQGDNDEPAKGPSTDDVQASRQVLVFSATFSKDLQQKLSSRKRHSNASRPSDLMSSDESMAYLLSKLPFRKGQQPKFIDVDPVSAMAPNLREALIECPSPMEKDLYLYALLLLHPRTRTLVFANSIAAVRRLVPFLQNLGLPAQALHSNMVQKARLRAVERFSTDSFKLPQQPNGNTNNGTQSPKNAAGILICTDIASRGLDIPGVDLIVHYHLPRAADSYVHRSGRTARAGAKGGSVLLCAPTEVMGMRRLVGRVHSDRSQGKTRALKSLELDGRVVSRLKERASLAKRIADVEAARALKGPGQAANEKGEKAEAGDRKMTQRDILRQAAEDLGVDYSSDSDDPTRQIKQRGVRGNQRRAQQKSDAEVSKGEIAGWKRELKTMLSQRVNVGVSERYITGSGVDLNGLLDGGGLWLGDVKGLDLGLGDD